MNKFIEKLKARLSDMFAESEECVHKMCESKTDEECRMVTCEQCYVAEMNKIVNELAEENNGGWIPCSERLPEEDVDVLCWYEYYRFGEYNGMYQTYEIGHYYKSMDFWGGEVSNGHKCKVIAWQPLPAPYNQKGE